VASSPRAGATAGPPWEQPGQYGTPLAGPGTGQPAAAGADDDTASLPRRVRQASLAPQLRDNPRRASAGGGEAAGPSPEELRKTMTALQRGWQSGRSQPVGGPAATDPPSGAAGPPPPEPTASDRGTAAHEPPGGPHEP
jgi:hypothetical protein